MMNYRPPQITDEHLRRNVALYIRQSSPEQVRNHVGSAMVQRNLATVLLAWGWPETAIEIRDDLGSSADEPGSREEIERLLADMRSGRLGAVATFAFNRIGRNELDQALFSYTARIYDVLLIVGTTVYDFRDPNSAFAATVIGGGAVHEHRVKIGLSREARRQKALARLAPTAPPIGFVKTKNGPPIKTKDDRVREVIQLAMDTFFRLRTGRGLVRYLRQHGIQLPHRVGPAGVEWRDATWSAVAAILKNPAYAGTYIYGKTRVVEAPDRTGRVKKRQVPVPKGEWVVMPRLFEGYMTPAQFVEAQEILAGNRTALRHPAPHGEALLQGHVRCAVHGKILRPHYDSGSYMHRDPDGVLRRPARYACEARANTGIWIRCIAVPARRLDPLFEATMLARLAPGILDELREAFSEDLRRHAMLLRAREDELRRAQRRAAELEREYFDAAAEPGLREVKSRLRTQWDGAQARVTELKTKEALEPATPPDPLSETETDELRQLLTDLPRLWRHPAVTTAHRKTMVRLLVKEVLLVSTGNEIEATVHWAGGGTDSLRFLSARGTASVAKQRRDEVRRRREIELKLREQILPIIHERFLAGDSYKAIARGLPASANRAIRTVEGVASAVRRMQQESVFGLPVLPRRVQRRKVPNHDA